jgi:uncharacterized protein (UPF0332 family)
MDKAALTHEVSNSLVLLAEELSSFVANANASLWRKAITNLYYAAYNATCALLWSKGIRADSHDGAQSMLSLHFVKAGALPAATTKNLNALMALRHAADYKGDVPIDPDDVRTHKAWALQFVEQALKLLDPARTKADMKTAEKALSAAKAVKIKNL